jgi:uncharacterized Zn finger protein
LVDEQIAYNNGSTAGWWVSRWQSTVSQAMGPTNTSEGRALVRKGLVSGLSVELGLLRGTVGGAEGASCRVRVSLRTLSDAEWDRCLDALASQAVYAAQLLNAELPRGVEGLMRGLGVPLFAEGRGDMEAECSCGHLRSCRHVAAVLIAAGERLADDPFLLFELRGRGRDDLVGALRERRLAVVAKQEAASRAVVAAGTSTEEALEGVTADAFWRMGAEVRGLPLRVEPPDMSMETLKVLGDLTFAEDEDLLPMLEPIYRQVTERALEVAYEDHQDAGED